MNNGDIITFNTKKNLTYIKPLGAGGTGDTHLFLDETTGIQFAIKNMFQKITDTLMNTTIDLSMRLSFSSTSRILTLYGYTTIISS